MPNRFAGYARFIVPFVLLWTALLLVPSAFAQTPVITYFSPTSAPAGGPGFNLTVSGSGFVGNIFNSSAVLWNGSPIPTSYVSPTQLVAVVSASLIATPGAATVTVENPGGALSNSLTFTITGAAPLSLTSLVPNFAPAGGPAFTLTANGTGFNTGSIVQWNGSPLSTFDVNSNQLAAAVPASLTATQGTATINVLNPDGSTSNSLVFTITAPGILILSSISPSNAPVGGGPFTLTANGSGFLPGAVLEWNGTPLASTYVSGTEILGLVPASLIASPGLATITVVNPSGATSNALGFTISGAIAPTLISLSPSSVPAGTVPFSLTVNGAGFLNGSVILWNGAALSTGYISSNQLGATVPANLIATPGIATITVLNPGGIASNSLTFTIALSLAPTLFSISPTAAAAGGPSFTLTLAGSGFVNGSIVEWNGTPVQTTYYTPASLTASISTALISAEGTANVTVVNPNGLTSNALIFTINGFENALRIAQVADGASWQTSFQVVNLDQVPVNFAFRFWDDNGNPLPLPMTSGVAGTFSGTLAVGGTAFASTPGTSGTLSEGWAEASASGRIGVLAIFSQNVPGRPASEGTVTGIQSGSNVFLPFDETNGYATGIAIANTNASQTLLVSILFQLENGNQLTGSLSLPPHAHTAFELTSRFPNLVGVRGSMQLTAQTPDIAVVGLRFSPDNFFTSLGQFQ